MATNPKTITPINKVSKEQLKTLAAGGTITKGDDSLTASQGTIYLTSENNFDYKFYTSGTAEVTGTGTAISISGFSANKVLLIVKQQAPSSASGLVNCAINNLSVHDCFDYVNNGFSTSADHSIIVEFQRIADNIMKASISCATESQRMVGSGQFGNRLLYNFTDENINAIKFGSSSTGINVTLDYELYIG